MTSRRRITVLGCVLLLVAGVAGWQWTIRGDDAGEPPHPLRAFLTPWYADLAANEDEPATVVVVGDSISEGSMSGVDVLTQRWQAVLQRQLRDDVGAAAGAVGFVPPYWGDALSTEVTIRSGVPSQEKRFGRWGLGGRALVMPGGASITYPPLPADRVRVGFGISDLVGGRARVLVDGVDLTARGTLNDPELQDDLASGTLLGAGESARAGLWWTSPELGPGQHTVRVDSLVPDFHFVHTGVEYLAGPVGAGVHVLDAAHAGATAAEFASLDAGAGTWAEIAARDADLVLINLGSNPDADFENNLAAVVERTLDVAPQAQVLVVDGYEPGTWEHEAWEELREARRRVVARHSDRVAVLDLAAEWPTLAKDGSTSEGLMAEVPPLHLTPQGHQRMADILTEWLTP